MAPSLPNLLAQVMATRKVTYMERREIEQETIGSKRVVVNEVRTRLMSYWGMIS